MDQPLTSTPKPKFSFSDSGSLSESPCISSVVKGGKTILLLFKKVRKSEDDQLKTNSAPSKSRRYGPPDPVPYRLSVGSKEKHQLVSTPIAQEEYDPNVSDKSFVETKFDVAKYFTSSRYSEVQKVVCRGSPGSTYALKKISVFGDGDVTPGNRRRECYYSLKLKHTNLVQTFDVYKQSGFFYVLMEYCVIDLKGVMQLKDDEAFGKKHYWDFICDMLRALLYLSEMGLLHLDIKPSNIMLSPRGIWKLGDYGLVCHKNDRVDYIESGDSKYSAPETRDKCYSAKCDLFSMGLVFIEMMLDADLPASGTTDSTQYHYIRNSTDFTWFMKPLKDNGYCDEAIRLTRRMIDPEYNRRPDVEVLCRGAGVRQKIQEREAEYGTPRTAEKMKDILDDLLTKDEQESRMLMERWQLEKTGDFSKSISEAERQLPTVGEVCKSYFEVPNGARPKHANTEPRNAGRYGPYLETPHLGVRNRLALRAPTDDLDTSPVAPAPCQDASPGREGSHRRLVFPGANRTKLVERRNLQKAFDETEDLDSSVSPIPPEPSDFNEGGACGGNGSWAEAGLSFLSSPNPPETQSDSSRLESCEELQDDSMDSDDKRTVTLDIRVLKKSLDFYNQKGPRREGNGVLPRPVPTLPNNGEPEAPAQNGVEDMETD